jgi:hypothetical protein
MKPNSNFRHNISTNKENMFCLKCVYIHLPTSEISRGGSVGIATGYGLNKGQDFLHSFQTGSGAHPASNLVGI